MEPKQRTWTEAPASWNIKYRINGFDEQITLRGESYSDIIEHVDAARSYVSKLLGAAPSIKAAAEAINIEPAPVTPTVPSAPTSAQTGGTFYISKMAVTPRADGKVELAFFESGHQYPDVKAVKTPPECAALLKPIGDWKPEHFGKAGEYPVVCMIDWTPSANLNKSGKPYKNIVAVKPANA